MQHSAADRLSLCAFKARCEVPGKTAQSGLQLGPLLDDLTTAMECAHQTQAFTPLGAMTRNLYTRHAENQPDSKGLGYSSIHHLFHEI
jgi:3-hydroxyisobutyrate dehydrogenase-like beta-hydroxyacid dehydrogenase